MSPPPASPVTEEAVRSALAAVRDPEVDEGIVDLGLLESVDIGAGHVSIVLVPTSATCPMADVLVDDATAAVQAIVPDGWTVDVQLDFDLFWTPDRMAASLRSRFGWSGGGPGGNAA